MADGIGIGPHAQLLLDQFAELALAAWGEQPYLVGSVHRTSTPRDIDVRLMVSAADFERLFGGFPSKDRHLSLGWRAQMLAWSTLGRSFTGLPIDFQIEPVTEANESYGDQPRSALGMRKFPRPMPRNRVYEDVRPRC